MAKSNIFEEHVFSTLRIIGHELLLSSNDSTSRVLPIKKEGDRYRLEFASNFAFFPEELAQIVDSISDENRIASHYAIEVLSCDSGLVVYSYEVDKEKSSNALACSGRLQPEGCYYILYRIISIMPSIENQGEVASFYQGPLKTTNGSSKSASFIYTILAIVLGFLIVLGLRKRNVKKGIHLIRIGDFTFDHKNMVLLRGKHKQELTGKETDLLQLLFTHLNSTVDRDRILKEVWRDEGVYIGRTLDVYISKLRKKFQSDPSINIINVRGVGYKLTLE